MNNFLETRHCKRAVINQIYVYRLKKTMEKKSWLLLCCTTKSKARYHNISCTQKEKTKNKLIHVLFKFQENIHSLVKYIIQNNYRPHNVKCL